MPDTPPKKSQGSPHEDDSPELPNGADLSHDLNPLFSSPRIYETRLKLAVAAANAGLWALNLDTYIFWVNYKIREMFSFPETVDITFAMFLAKLHPDDIPIVEEGMQRALEGKEHISIEFRILYPDGSIRWINSRGALQSEGDTPFASLMGVSVDITERKIKEEAIALHHQFESVLTDIAADFARFMLPAEIDNKIEQGLHKLLDYLGCDRCGLVQLDLQKMHITVMKTAHLEKVYGPVPNDNHAKLFPWVINQIKDGTCCYFSNFEELPPEAAVDIQNWMAMGVKSVLHLPLKVDESRIFMLVISSITRTIIWQKKLIPRIQLVGEFLLNAIYRKVTEEERRNSYDEIAMLKEKLEIEADYLRAEVRSIKSLDDFIGQSEPFTKVLGMIAQVASTTSSVLVSGETGTGKELIAQAIHNNSPRHNKMMVKVNCASLPSSLVESELFGRERGAYTGALTRQIGRFELADGSTLFLDEIAELSLELQAKLLRVLQSGEFERLGSPRTIKVNVRLIAATNRNLREEVDKGKFREDLYYRLNVFPIYAPPLRERKEDIPMLAWAFVREFNETMGKRISRIRKNDMAELQAYPWPGNIRELRNVIEHAVIVSQGEELKVRLPENGRNHSSPTLSLQELESRHIEEVLRQTGWRIKGDGGAAGILGLNPATLYSRMKKLGISSRRKKDGI